MSGGSMDLAARIMRKNREKHAELRKKKRSAVINTPAHRKSEAKPLLRNNASQEVLDKIKDEIINEAAKVKRKQFALMIIFAFLFVLLIGIISMNL